MFVHLMEAVEHFAKVFRADGDHRGEADCRIHGIPPADPVPKLEHIGRIDAEFRDFLGIGRNGDEMASDGMRDLLGFRNAQRRAPCECVGHRLERREGF